MAAIHSSKPYDHCEGKGGVGTESFHSSSWQQIHQKLTLGSYRRHTTLLVAFSFVFLLFWHKFQLLYSAELNSKDNLFYLTDFSNLGNFSWARHLNQVLFTSDSFQVLSKPETVISLFSLYFSNTDTIFKLMSHT